jgi:hypothetical protein
MLALDKGMLDALYMIGKGYADSASYNEQTNYRKGQKWYELAAEFGNSPAMNSIGWMYDYGRGVPEDTAKAIVWYTKAARHGNADAWERLRKLGELKVLQEIATTVEPKILLSAGVEYLNVLVELPDRTKTVAVLSTVAAEGNGQAIESLKRLAVQGDSAAMKAVEALKISSASRVPTDTPQQKPRTVAATPPKKQKDKTPPVITITSPAESRGLKLVSTDVSLTVAGTVHDDSGVAEVTVNDQTASLDEKGNFSAAVLLKVGENSIVVSATDINHNSAVKRFTYRRDSQVTAPKPATPTLQTGDYHALLIGVQDYRSSEINKLDFPVADAEKLQQLLISGYQFSPGNVTLLKNPDRKAILRAFEQLRKRLTTEDSLLIFFAGHGVWNEEMRQGYWLPVDAAGMDDPSDWIPNSVIRDYLKGIKARHILLVADACFSGGIFKVRDAFNRASVSMQEINKLKSRKAITSGALKTVPDRSVFVQYLLARLSDNREPYLDTQKLFASFREAVINNSATNQTPLYGAIAEADDEGGDFIFVRH